MYSSICQYVFVSVFSLALIIYVAFLVNLRYLIFECKDTPTLEYCVEIHPEKAKEFCSIVLAASDSNSTSNELGTTLINYSIATLTPAPTSLETAGLTSLSTKATSISPAITPSTPPSKIRENNPWWTCPEPGRGRQSVVLGAIVAGRLGNVVWSYLSVLLTAQIYGLRPVLHNSTIGFLVRDAFDIDHIRMPTLEWLDQKCNMSGWLDKAVRNVSLCKTFYSRRELHQALEKPPEKGIAMYRYSYYVTTTELLVPYFYEMKKELVLQKDKTLHAQKHLLDVKTSHLQYLRRQNISKTDIEFVGVHVRRTDYVHHMNVVFPLGKLATPKFFHVAMDWFINELNTPVAFVVVSDDKNWTKANIVVDRKDVYLGGDGDISNPGADLAILAACNHTIFAYGTFGLTGAFLASRPGGYTIIFDPENGTVTKEMEFASNLPGWRIMTEDGKITYRENLISYAFYGHPRVDVSKNAK